MHILGQGEGQSGENRVSFLAWVQFLFLSQGEGADHNMNGKNISCVHQCLYSPISVSGFVAQTLASLLCPVKVNMLITKIMNSKKHLNTWKTFTMACQF